MGIFARLEAFLERLFEAPAGRLGATLQPVLLTKRIERAMDSGKTLRRGRRHRPEPLRPAPPSRRFRGVRALSRLARGRPGAWRGRSRAS